MIDAVTTLRILVGLCAFLLLAFLGLSLWILELDRAVRRQGPPHAGDDQALAQELRELRQQIHQTSGGVTDTLLRLERCVQGVGVVRYDAFQDVGGHLSFSLALLDGREDGVVLSVLNGRDGSRGYAKAVAHGTAVVALSEEEREALNQALKHAG